MNCAERGEKKEPKKKAIFGYAGKKRTSLFFRRARLERKLYEVRKRKGPVVFVGRKKKKA